MHPSHEPRHVCGNFLKKVFSFQFSFSSVHFEDFLLVEVILIFEKLNNPVGDVRKVFLGPELQFPELGKFPVGNHVRAVTSRSVLTLTLMGNDNIKVKQLQS